VKHESTVKNLRDKIEKARNNINNNSIKLNLEGATKIDEDYARLKILWRCKQNDDIEALNSLADLLDKNPSLGIIGFFKERDKIAWKRLKRESNSPEKNWLKFTSPQERTVDPIQAYELIQFKVESIPRSLGNNYLFENGLDYHWVLDLETETWPWRRLWKKITETKKLATPQTKEPRLVWWRFWKKIPETKRLATPWTKEPRLFQYVPRKGKLHVSIQLFYNNDDTPVVSMGDVLEVEKSKDFGWIRSFRFVEITALAIATLFAVISGLQIYYIGKPDFGSLVNYVNLFIWGAAVDQGKNFVQLLAQSRTAKDTSS
jgi:hypothetical protein